MSEIQYILKDDNGLYIGDDGEVLFKTSASKFKTSMDAYNKLKQIKEKFPCTNFKIYPYLKKKKIITPSAPIQGVIIPGTKFFSFALPPYKPNSQIEGFMLEVEVDGVLPSYRYAHGYSSSAEPRFNDHLFTPNYTPSIIPVDSMKSITK